MLAELTLANLKEIGIQSLGHRVLILKAIKQLYAAARTARKSRNRVRLSAMVEELETGQIRRRVSISALVESVSALPFSKRMRNKPAPIVTSQPSGSSVKHWL